jgi:RNA polymerase sigma factor (sigma-70 family)
MSDPSDFDEFIRRIRAGDDQAAAELVGQYEPLIRREVRLHLEERHLRQIFDSMDISQSVLLSFFLRTAAGQYDLERPEQLLHLLVKMTRNKLASAARREHRQRRDQRRQARDPAALGQAVDPEPTPAEQVARQELLQQIRQGLDDEERSISDLRSQGQSWEEVAATLGGTAQGRRMQLTRAVERTAHALGLEEDDV